MIKRTVTHCIEPTPEELANGFCELDSEGQAQFFNEVAVIVAKWAGQFAFQLEGVSQSMLTSGGRRIMELIGDYAHHNERGR